MPERITEEAYMLAAHQSKMRGELTSLEAEIIRDEASAVVVSSRTATMIRLYGDGYTLQEIADRYNVTRQRVQQILQGAGGGYRANLEERKKIRVRRALREAGVTRDDVGEAYKRGGSVKAVAAKLGLPKEAVASVMRELAAEGFPLNAYRNTNEAQNITDEFLLSEVMRAAQIFGEPLGRFQYAQRSAEFGLPADNTLMRRFGSFAAACVLAGVRCNRPQGKRASSFSEDDCIAALQLCAEDAGRIPSIGVYEAWWREMDGRHFKKSGDGLPGQLTIRNAFGGWRQALHAAFGG